MKCFLDKKKRQQVIGANYWMNETKRKITMKIEEAREHFANDWFEILKQKVWYLFDDVSFFLDSFLIDSNSFWTHNPFVNPLNVGRSGGRRDDVCLCLWVWVCMCWFRASIDADEAGTLESNVMCM